MKRTRLLSPHQWIAIALFFVVLAIEFWAHVFGYHIIGHQFIIWLGGGVLLYIMASEILFEFFYYHQFLAIKREQKRLGVWEIRDDHLTGITHSTKPCRIPEAPIGEHHD